MIKEIKEQLNTKEGHGFITVAVIGGIFSASVIAGLILGGIAYYFITK